MDPQVDERAAAFGARPLSSFVRDDEIAGIVSERDLLRAIGQAGPKVLEQPVSDFMTKTVITARGRLTRSTS